MLSVASFASVEAVFMFLCFYVFLVSCTMVNMMRLFEEG